MSNEQAPGKDEADRLYEQYVKPLQRSHRGGYVGVSIDGKIVIGSTLIEVVRDATHAFGKGNSVIFRVGDKIVGRVRRRRRVPRQPSYRHSSANDHAGGCPRLAVTVVSRSHPAVRLRDLPARRQ